MTSYNWHQQTFWLSADRVMYWENEKILIASDLHIGKTGHFRKNGVAVPQGVYKDDLQRLFAALQYFQPKQFVIAGDLFHSHANRELDWFARWRNDLSLIDFVLIKGNHDILPESWYEMNNIRSEKCLIIKRLLFVHDMECDEKEQYQSDVDGIISGHVHPAVLMRSGARQQMRFPCFYFNKTQCILPAYSHFSGTYTVKAKKEDKIFAITGKEILSLKQ